MSRLLPDDSPRTIVIACGLGMASSSCSYAAVALARSMFRKGANFTAAMAFQFASTNLVLELGILLAVLMGWQFTLAEFTGGPIMIILLVLLFKAFLTPKLVEAAKEQADKGYKGAWKAMLRVSLVFEKQTGPEQGDPEHQKFYNMGDMRDRTRYRAKTPRSRHACGCAYAIKLRQFGLLKQPVIKRTPSRCSSASASDWIYILLADSQCSPVPLCSKKWSGSPFCLRTYDPLVYIL